jgi:tyrosinase
VEITEPLGLPEHNLEVQHGEIHSWVDGQLGELSTAAHDPVFYLHHCFVDYLWEQFRQKQRSIPISKWTICYNAISVTKEMFTP